ncbi:hypothetical protein [Flavobacterium chungangensis]|uniref:Lipoprotein n=1 Tax=Flavobacterium chungangensis TaxID=2708132 RepID=A0ABV8Z976_9FLAO
MERFTNYISVTLLAITLFSCAKNEWTPEIEAKFKVDAKEGMLKKGKGMLSEDQVDYIVDCSVQKFKQQNILPNDAKKPENESKVKQAAKECAQEWLTKNQDKIGKSILAE